MLVLSRKVGERIVLPDSGVRIVLLSIHAGRVRIGIEAPAGVAVHREEVWRRVTSEAGRSSALSPAPPSECDAEALCLTRCTT